MLTGIGIVLAGIAIILLLIYAADVAAIQAANDPDTKQGFLPFDAKIRGMALGAPALILPFIAFGITWKSPSKILGVMIIITGILIMAGGAFILASTDMQEAKEAGRPVAMESAMLIGAGVIHIAMGAFTIYRGSRN